MNELTCCLMLDSPIVALSTIRDNADRFAESAKSDLKCLCSKSTTDLSERTIPKTMDVSLLKFYCIRNK